MDSNFLEAADKTSSFDLLKSILWDTKVVKRGVRWRVGTGKKINSFHNQWISLNLFVR